MNSKLSNQQHLLDMLAKKEQEIVELKNSNALLSRQIDHLDNIIAEMPGNVFWKDINGKYLGCNKTFVRVLGLNSRQDVVGKTNREIVQTEHYELIDIATQADNEVLISGEKKYFEEKGFNSKKEPAIYLSQKIPLYDQHQQLIGLLGVSFDITERKQMEKELIIAKEKAEAANIAKSQFVAVINHELRTPLSSILGLIGFLNSPETDKQESNKIIKSIENCTQYLLNLVNDVLDFRTLEVGKYEISLEPLNLNNMIDDIHGLLEPLARAKGLSLILDIPLMNYRIISDSSILRQMLTNLISNAIKYTDTGHVKVIASIIATTTSSIEINIDISDTGRGIPPDKLEVIFKPFQQIENAYTRRSSRRGTGLGLSIVKKLAKLIGVNIFAASILNEGSTFSIHGEFPTCAASEPADVVPLNAAEACLHAPLKKTRVLLVEDDEFIQYIHEKMLADFGCTVDIANNGQEAVSFYKDHDIIFVDISLPDMNGFELIQALRQQLSLQHIPIVALTVYTGNEEKAGALAAGATEFHSKPVSAPQLQEIVRRLVKQ